MGAASHLSSCSSARTASEAGVASSSKGAGVPLPRLALEDAIWSA